MPRVANVNQLGSKGWSASHVYVGRSPRYGGPTPLGNPFSHLPSTSTNASYRTGSVEEAVEMYRIWLHYRIKLQDRPEVLLALARIREESVLVCHCDEGSPCHARVIVKAWEWLYAQHPKWFVDLVTQEVGTASAIVRTDKELFDE